MITHLTLLRHWLPIALMWALMAAEGPLHHGIVARAPNPDLNLAAYGYGFFSMLILESPVFMFITASNTLIKGPLSYRSFRNYAYPIALIFTLLVLLIGTSDLFLFISIEYVGVSREIALLSEKVFLWLSPSPLMVGYRRFHQGLLVQAKESKWVGYGGVLRLITLGGVALTLFFLTTISGAEIAAIAVTSAIIIESYFIRWRSAKLQRDFSRYFDEANDESLTLRKIHRFYFPLAISSFVIIGTQPLATFFLARSVNPEQSLAAWPVVMSFQWIFTCTTLALLEVVITYHDDTSENLKTLREFTLGLTTFLSALCLIVALTPLYSLYFEEVIGLSKELSSYMYSATLASVLLIPVTAWEIWLRAIHTLRHTTKRITEASILELIALGITLWGFFSFTSLSGVLIGTLGFTVARLVAALYLKIRM